MDQTTATSQTATAHDAASAPRPGSKPDSVRLLVMDVIQAYPLAAVAIVFAAGYVVSRIVQRFR